MIIYEVNHDVEKEIEKEYTVWLESHIQEMLGFEGFESIDWYKLASENDQQMVRWSIHYHVRSMSDLQSYLDTHAERMRADGAHRFGGRYRANRRILSLLRHSE
jgi:Domain of unknown function (DUF4286)